MCLFAVAFIISVACNNSIREKKEATNKVVTSNIDYVMYLIKKDGIVDKKLMSKLDSSIKNNGYNDMTAEVKRGGEKIDIKNIPVLEFL